MPDVERREPAYVQIATHYRDAILSGELSPGDRLPSITDIAEQWNVARATATDAIGRLRVEKAVYTSPQGTFASSDDVITRTPGDRIRGPQANPGREWRDCDAERGRDRARAELRRRVARHRTGEHGHPARGGHRTARAAPDARGRLDTNPARHGGERAARASDAGGSDSYPSQPLPGGASPTRRITSRAGPPMRGKRTRLSFRPGARSSPGYTSGVMRPGSSCTASGSCLRSRSSVLARGSLAGVADLWPNSHAQATRADNAQNPALLHQMAAPSRRRG